MNVVVPGSEQVAWKEHSKSIRFRVGIYQRSDLTTDIMAARMADALDELPAELKGHNRAPTETPHFTKADLKVRLHHAYTRGSGGSDVTLPEQHIGPARMPVSAT